MYLYINEGGRCSIAVANLNNDSFPDMIIGNYSGGVSFFKGVTPSPVGISEFPSNQNQLEIYPNPASNTVSIKIPNSLSGLINIEIYDYRGSEISKNHLKISGQIYTAEISGFSNGLYFIMIHDDAGKIFYTGKLMVIR